MRTAIQSDAFIQLITAHKIKLSFILETEKGAKGKIAKRQRDRRRESEHWAAADIALENIHV
jgi:hypothetical protein